ncbi:hypothetical protein U9M48_023763, partial [Paspalum notatum var. saurae]
DGFNPWWDFWKPHLFQHAVSLALLAINPDHEATPEEDNSSHSQVQEADREEVSHGQTHASSKETSGHVDEGHSAEPDLPKTFDVAALLNFDPSSIGESLATKSPPTLPMTASDVISKLGDIAKQLETPIEQLVIECDRICTALELIADVLPTSMKQVGMEAMVAAPAEDGQQPKSYHVNEEQTQEQPLIEEPEDPEPYPRQEDLRRAADSAPDDTDPSEEGMEFLFCACVGGGACYH